MRLNLVFTFLILAIGGSASAGPCDNYCDRYAGSDDKMVCRTSLSYAANEIQSDFVRAADRCTNIYIGLQNDRRRIEVCNDTYLGCWILRTK